MFVVRFDLPQNASFKCNHGTVAIRHFNHQYHQCFFFFFSFPSDPHSLRWNDADETSRMDLNWNQWTVVTTNRISRYFILTNDFGSRESCRIGSIIFCGHEGKWKTALIWKQSFYFITGMIWLHFSTPFPCNGSQLSGACFFFLSWLLVACAVIMGMCFFRWNDDDTGNPCSPKTPLFIVGSHQLKGKIESLKQPFCVLKKVYDEKQQLQQYEVVGMVQSKFLFNQYPKTIMRWKSRRKQQQQIYAQQLPVFFSTFCFVSCSEMCPTSLENDYY